MIVWQDEATLGNAIDAVGLAGALIEDEVAPSFFLVWEDLEQDEIADDGVVDLRIIERLVLVIDGFAKDSPADLGVIFNFDGEVAADGLDEDAVFNADVGVQAGTSHIAGGALPDEFLGCGENVFVIAAVP